MTEKLNHKNTLRLISLTITFVYWGTSTIVLLSFAHGFNSNIPDLIYYLCLPGYYLGLAFGFIGGNSWIIIGQLISLLLIYVIVHSLTILISKAMANE